MESSIAFLVFAASLWAAWCRGPQLAMLLFTLGIVLTVAVYLHHASEALPLSF